MSGNEDRVTAADRLKAWAVVLGICAAILAYGAIVFFAVGDKGPPAFDYGAVNFVPGGSPYTTRPVDRDMWKP